MSNSNKKVCRERLKEIADRFLEEDRIDSVQHEDFIALIQDADLQSLKDCLDDYEQESEHSWLAMWVW